MRLVATTDRCSSRPRPHEAIRSRRGPPPAGDTHHSLARASLRPCDQTPTVSIHLQQGPQATGGVKPSWDARSQREAATSPASSSNHSQLYVHRPSARSHLLAPLMGTADVVHRLCPTAFVRPVARPSHRPVPHGATIHHCRARHPAGELSGTAARRRSCCTHLPSRASARRPLHGPRMS